MILGSGLSPLQHRSFFLFSIRYQVTRQTLKPLLAIRIVRSLVRNLFKERLLSGLSYAIQQLRLLFKVFIFVVERFACTHTATRSSPGWHSASPFDQFSRQANRHPDSGPQPPPYWMHGKLG